jgi:hypothetical protein
LFFSISYGSEVWNSKKKINKLLALESGFWSCPARGLAKEKFETIKLEKRWVYRISF